MKNDKGVVYYHGEDGEIIRYAHTFTEYDGSGRIVRETEFSGGCPEKILEYDAAGRVWLVRNLLSGKDDPGPEDLHESEYSQYFPDGRIKRFVKTEYQDGKMTGFEIGREDRDNGIWIKIRYDETGRVEKASVCPEAGTSIEFITVKKRGETGSISYPIDDFSNF